MSIPRCNIPLCAKGIDTAYVSLWDLSGGHRWYALNAATVNISLYLPVPTAGTRLVFVRADAGTSGKWARILAKTTALLNGSATDYEALYLAGDAIEVVPDPTLSGWITPSRRSTLFW